MNAFVNRENIEIYKTKNKIKKKKTMESFFFYCKPLILSECSREKHIYEVSFNSVLCWLVAQAMKR